jgi:hypothetical protein
MLQFFQKLPERYINITISRKLINVLVSENSAGKSKEVSVGKLQEFIVIIAAALLTALVLIVFKKNQKKKALISACQPEGVAMN